jgi:hypothetical protein
MASGQDWKFSLTTGFFETNLEMDGRFEADLREWMVVSSLAYRVGELTVAGKLGAIIDGALDAGERFRIKPGVLLGASVDWPILRGGRDLVSLALSGQFGLAMTALEREADTSRWIALDFRVGLTVSRTFFDVLTPYASARAFGGPIFWSGFEAERAIDGEKAMVVGSDPRHTQLAAGLGVALGDHLDLHFEWAFFGEAGLYWGLGAAF